MGSSKLWHTVIAPYSLEKGHVGEPVGSPLKRPHPSDVEALIDLGTIIFGAHWKMPYRVAGRGNGFRLFVMSPEGEELCFNVLYRRVEDFLGEGGRPLLKRTMEDIGRYRSLFDKS